METGKAFFTFYPHDSLTPKEVAEILRINPGTVYNWIYAGQIPSLKLGRLRRIRMEVVKQIQEQGLKKEAPTYVPRTNK